MAASTEDEKLATKYDLIRLSVISSSSITARTSTLINHLSSPKTDAARPAVVSLHAKAAVANKLISIVEIAKRELTAKSEKLYQYSALASEIVPLKKANKPINQNGAAANSEADPESEEDAFQTMGEKEKIRAVPILTVYLSRVPVKELRDAHG